MLTLTICIPVYDDWTSALALLAHIDRVAPGLSARLRLLFVDDGSSEAVPPGLQAPINLARVSVLRLRRNLGHQRAIAIGLTHLFVAQQAEAVIVMDGDGEDSPDTLRALLDCWRANEPSCVVFATRAERCESTSFRAGYVVYKLLHRLLVGRWMKVGNFSLVPREALKALVAVSELWNHYAAAVLSARLPVATVALPRGRRIAGRSKMNFVALIVHGLSAISVHSSQVAVRVLVLVVALMVALLLAIAVVVGVRFGSQLAIPGWATSTVGVLLVLLLNLALISMLMILFALRARSEAAFIPLRDFGLFVAEERVLFEGTDEE
jgi:polyisoprenyl-phosphate glycosyltransferase